MPVHGQALRMRSDLHRLAQRHGVALADAVTLPLAPATSGAMVLEGFATTPDIDLTRLKFRPHAICWPPLNRAAEVPLLYRHDHDQVAGIIESLSYDAGGRLT